MNPPEQQDPSAATPSPARRTRPAGRLTAGLWILLPGLALAGALALVALWHLPLQEQAARETSRRLENATQAKRDLREATRRLGEQERECRRQQARFAAGERRERALRELAAPLLGALADKKIEEVPADPAVRAVLERASPELLDLALIDSAGQQVFVRRGGPGGSLREILPELAAAYTPDRPSPPLSQPGWHWAPVKGYNLALACRFADEPLPEEKPSAAEPEAEEGPQGMAAVRGVRPWHLLLVAAVGLALLLFGWIWVDARALRPLHVLSRHTRDALEDPTRAAFPPVFQAGPARELSLSLQRCQQALQRLHEQDQAAEERRRSLEALVSLLEAVRRGDLGQRIQDLCPELALLGSTLNSALEEIAGRMRAAQEGTAHMEDAAQRLLLLAEEAGGRIPAPDAETLADPTLLADAVELQLAEIFAAARALFDSPQPDTTPEAAPSPPEEALVLEEMRREVESLQRAAQALEPFFTELTSLATTLAVAAQSGAVPNLEEMARRARSLVQAREAARSDLESCRRQLSRGLDTWAGAAGELETLRALRHRLTQTRRELLARLSAFEPIGRGLGERVRKLVQEIQQRRSQQRALREFVAGLAEAARSLASAGRELVTHLRSVQTAASLRSPTREMAEHLGRLHQALEHLAQTADRDGIQALRPETAEIVRRIQDSAARVQQRLSQEPPAPTAPGSTA